MRRNKHIYTLIAVVILLPLLFLACLTSPASSTPTDAQPSALTQLQTRVTTAEGNINSKASAGSVTALETRMATAEGNINALEATGPGNTYTKAQVDAAVDAAILAAITALKEDSDQSWITVSTSTSSSSGGSSTGGVTFTTNPATVPQLFSSNTGSNQLFYTMQITNGLSQWQYVKPVITLSIASSYSATTITALTISMSSGAGSMSGTFAAPNNFSISPTTAGVTATPSIVLIPISGGNTTSGEFQIGAGQSVDVLISIQITSGTTVLWNVSNSISNRGL